MPRGPIDLGRRRSGNPPDGSRDESPEKTNRAAVGAYMVGRSPGGPERDRRIFKRNVKLLWRRSGLSGVEVSERIGAARNPEWFRSILTYGISRVTKANRERLGRLAELFGVQLDGLWSEDVIAFSVADSGSLAADDQLAELAWRKNRMWPRIRKYKTLLASGKYAYLEQLVDTLHAKHRADLRREARRISASQAGEDRASPKDLIKHRRLARGDGGA